MADDSAPINKTQLAVALIGLASAVAVALIANGDKLFHHPASGRGDTQAAASVAPPADGAAAARVASGSPAGAGGESAAPEVVAGGGGAVPSLAGPWHDSDGYSFRFAQHGDRYTYRALRDGIDVGGGSGRITGHALSHAFTSPDGTGTCEAALSDDGLRIHGTCHQGGASWELTVDRGPAKSG